MTNIDILNQIFEPLCFDDKTVDKILEAMEIARSYGYNEGANEERIEAATEIKEHYTPNDKH